MRPELLNTVSRRNGLHAIWCPKFARPKASWIKDISRALVSQGPVVILDFAGVIGEHVPDAHSLLDFRLHQGSPDHRDDHTIIIDEGLHYLPSGFYDFPETLEPARLRNLLVNLQLVRDQFSSTILILPQGWKPWFAKIVQSASSFTIVSDQESDSQVFEILRDFGKSFQVPLIWLGDSWNKADSSRIAFAPFYVCNLPFEQISPDDIASQLFEARRVHILQQNPLDGWKRLFHRVWWVLGILIMLAVLAMPIALDSPDSLFRDLDAEKRLYSGKPFFQFRFNGTETAQRLARHSIGRFTALVVSESEIHDYLVESIVKNRQDTGAWKREPSGIFTPSDGIMMRFYPPEHLYNPDADSLMPAWRYFTSLLSDSLAYVTEYYNVTGKGGRRHLGIDVAGRHGSRILAPFSGKAWTTFDDRGGVVIALVSGKSVLLFMHCDQLLYMDGQDVFKGDPLATVGMTGHTTGPHMHLVTGRVSTQGGMTAGPVRYNPVDPVRWVYEDALKLREN